MELKHVIKNEIILVFKYSRFRRIFNIEKIDLKHILLQGTNCIEFILDNERII